ncbi:LysR family transcriptional regulator [Rhizobium grahamii]|uniref:HTH-type transcriptional regulator TtuA n=1 Tax=Rhizobium grahamii CCGE 502 TaxID=990285 RepID=S3HCR3_9HYPH|nr:LysR family transcriptional regulator [Rhizobium grahamii]EPE96522.1 LysR family transcriptional regulator [Rhizobium grahamii CCGE 502]
MKRDEFTEMRAFLVVARERSFTRAAAKLGVTRSALSHTVRGLEARLGMRLLSRTTRDVAPTVAGERLMESIQPHFDGIAAGINAISALRDKPSGQVRVVCPDDAVELVFRHRLPTFLQEFPEIGVEIIVDNGFTNIVERQFDAGVRLGEAVARDMVAVRVGPDVSYSVVASPGYLERCAPPSVPQDLTDHNCVNLRLPTSGALYAWEFKREEREFSVRVGGQLTLSNMASAVDAALDGIGLAYLPTDLVSQHVERGKLRRLLLEWCPIFKGYHLYYPSRRNPSPAFSAFVDAFRYRPPS